MNVFQSPKPARSELSAGQMLCDFCTAKCCRYFALGLDPPSTVDEFQYLRWFVMHDATCVFVEDGAWYLLVQTECQHLLADHRCGIYADRPAVCREYETDKCEYDDQWTYEMYFETSEQIQEYCEARFANPGDPGFRSPRPSLLPVIERASLSPQTAERP